MTVHSSPNRTLGRRHVVIRRADILICCSRLETRADPQWRWQQVSCDDDVRVQRGEEVVWADHADFWVDGQDLVLSGRPLLHRGMTWLAGERVSIDWHGGLARILRPRGHLPGVAQAPTSTTPCMATTSPLPRRCPIAPRPR